MRYSKIYFVLLFLAILAGCNRNPKVTRNDTPTSGQAIIAADECLQPIIQEELAVFTGLNPEANITPVFTSEQEAFKLLLSDSIRLIFAARDLTEQEKEHIRKLKRTPRTQKIAIDGIALIVSKRNTDTIISVANLKKIITGEITNWKDITLQSNKNISRPLEVVFDNKNSSTVRFIKDSICKGAPMSGQLHATSSNLSVIEHVTKNPNAMGIIGVNWVSNPNDSSQLDFDKNIQVMYISTNENASIYNSYQPVPAYLGTLKYPLVRDIFAIISDVRGGLPAGFVAFVASDSGQRIILKAGLVPATRPTRLINIKNEFSEE